MSDPDEFTFPTAIRALEAHRQTRGAFRIIVDAEMGEPRTQGEDVRTTAMLLDMIKYNAARVFDALQQAGYIPTDEMRPEIRYRHEGHVSEVVQYTLPPGLTLSQEETT